jgi:hypothetical protein
MERITEATKAYEAFLPVAQQHTVETEEEQKLREKRERKEVEYLLGRLEA